jgi:hypothetical protein
MLMNWADKFAERAERRLSIERADSRDRGPSTGNRGGGSSSRTSGGGSGGGSQLPGSKAPPLAGNATVADHMIATGQISAPSVPAGGVAQGNYPTQDDAYADYAKAVGDYATRTWANKLADFLGGSFYDENEPMAGNPRSFAGGRFHTSSNPAGIAAGMVAPWGSGLVAGPVAAKIYGAAGLPDIWHGGYDQPDIRTGFLGNAPAGTDLGKTFSDLGGMGGSGSSGGSGVTRAGGHGDRTSQGTPLLPPVTPTTPQATTTPTTSVTGSLLPPIAKPDPRLSAGGFMSIPGASPYGWMLPAYQY